MKIKQKIRLMLKSLTAVLQTFTHFDAQADGKRVFNVD